MDRVIEQKKGLKKKHIPYIGGGLFFIVILYYAFFVDHVSTLRVDKSRLIIEEVIAGVFDDYTTINGQVEPISTVFLDVQEGGRVEEKPIEEGSMVKQGDVILRLSNPDLSMNILDSEAQLAEKSNFLRNTLVTMEQERLQIKRELLNLTYEISRLEREYKANEVLFHKKDGLVSEEVYLLSKEKYEYAIESYGLFLERQRQDSIFRSVQVMTIEDNLANMKRNLDLVKLRQENLNVKAPIDGQLGTLNAEIGQSIPRGQSVGQINVLTSHRITSWIDEHYIDRVRAGLLAKFVRNSVSYSLKVRRVFPQVRDSKFLIDMIFEGVMPENIRTGQSYHIDIQLGSPDTALLIPKGGFFNDTGGQWIYVLDPSGEFAVRRSITLGTQNPKYYEVTGGLEAGERVIVSGYTGFGNNERLIFK